MLIPWAGPSKIASWIVVSRICRPRWIKGTTGFPAFWSVTWQRWRVAVQWHGLVWKVREKKPKIHWFIMVHHFVIKIAISGYTTFSDNIVWFIQVHSLSKVFFRFLQRCKSLRDGGEDNLTDVRGFTVAHLAASMYGGAIPKFRSNKRLLYLLVPAIHFNWHGLRLPSLTSPCPTALWHGTPCPAAVCCRQCSGKFDPCVSRRLDARICGPNRKLLVAL